MAKTAPNTKSMGNENFPLCDSSMRAFSKILRAQRNHCVTDIASGAENSYSSLMELSREFLPLPLPADEWVWLLEPAPCVDFIRSDTLFEEFNFNSMLPHE